MSELARPFLKRLDTPVVITFVTVFILYNWKFFYILFIPIKLQSEQPRIDLALEILSSTQYFVLGPIVLSIVSLALIPILDYCHNIYTLWMIKQNELLKKNSELDLQSEIFTKEADTHQTLQKIANSQSNIRNLRKEILDLKRSNAITNKNGEDFYNSLRESEKHHVAKAIISARTIFEYEKNYGSREKTAISIIENDPSQRMRMTGASMAFLVKYDSQFSGKLAED